MQVWEGCVLKPSPLFLPPTTQNFYFSINRTYLIFKLVHLSPGRTPVWNITSLSLSATGLPHNHHLASQCFGTAPVRMLACTGLQKQLLSWRHETLPSSEVLQKSGEAPRAANTALLTVMWNVRDTDLHFMNYCIPIYKMHAEAHLHF